MAFALGWLLGCAVVDPLGESKPMAGQPTLANVRVQPGGGLPEVEYQYRPIPAGTFTMGSPRDEDGRDETESPQHQVTISAFELGRYEVRNSEYKRFLIEYPGVPTPEGWEGRAPAEELVDMEWQNMPATGMTWDEAALFASWMGARLPTEAEWEYAARAGTTGARYGALDDIAWYDVNSDGLKHVVAEKQLNAFGLYDMLGNAYEWCADRYALYGPDPVTDPQGAPSGPTRIVRGGSWGDSKIFSRAAYRSVDPPGRRSGDYGFRLARDLTDDR